MTTEVRAIPKQCPKCGYKGRPCELGCGGKDCPMLAARIEREQHDGHR